MIYVPQNNAELKKLCSDPGIKLSEIDVQKVDDLSEIFYVSEDDRQKGNFRRDFQGMESWKVDHVKNMSLMVYNNPVFDVNLSSWNTSQVENMKGIFGHCGSFTGQGLDKWNFDRCKNLSVAFCYTKMEVNLSKVLTPNLEYYDYLMAGATGPAAESLKKNLYGMGHNIFERSLPYIMESLKQCVIKNLDLNNEKGFALVKNRFDELKSFNFTYKNGEIYITYGSEVAGLFKQDQPEALCKFINFCCSKVSDKFKYADLSLVSIGNDLKAPRDRDYADEIFVDKVLQQFGTVMPSVMGPQNKKIEFIKPAAEIFNQDNKYFIAGNTSADGIKLDFSGKLNGFEKYFEKNAADLMESDLKIKVDKRSEGFENFKKDCDQTFDDLLNGRLASLEILFNEDLPMVFSASGFFKEVAIGHCEGKEWFYFPLYKEVGAIDNQLGLPDDWNFSLYRYTDLSTDRRFDLEALLEKSKEGLYESCILDVLGSYEYAYQTDQENFKKDFPGLIKEARQEQAVGRGKSR